MNIIDLVKCENWDIRHNYCKICIFPEKGIG